MIWRPEKHKTKWYNTRYEVLQIGRPRINRDSPNSDKLIFEEVFGEAEPMRIDSPYSNLIGKGEENEVLNLQGFVDHTIVNPYESSIVFNNLFRSYNVISLRQAVDPSSPLRIEKVMCLAPKGKENERFYPNNSFIEITGKIKTFNSYKLIIIDSYKDIKFADLSSVINTRPILSQKTIIEALAEVYGNKNFSKCLYNNLTISPTGINANSHFVPINKTESGDEKGAHKIAHLVDAVKEDLRFIFPKEPFYKDNPLIKVGWDTRYKSINAVNFFATTEILTGQEVYNQTARLPMFMNSNNIHYNQSLSIIQDLAPTIRRAIIQQRFLKSTITPEVFEESHLKHLKNMASERSDGELQEYIGTTTPEYHNRDSPYSRTGGSYDIAHALAKFGDVKKATKEVANLYESYLVTESLDLIKDKENIRHVGQKLLRIHNNFVRGLIKSMNEEMQTKGNLQGLTSEEVMRLLEKHRLRQGILYEAENLGLITKSLSGLYRPHHVHLDI